MTTGITFRAGAVGRLICGLAVAAAGLVAVLPQPTAAVWQASVILSEWGHWLAALALLLLPGGRRSGADAAGAAAAAAGIVLLLSPLARALPLNDSLPPLLERAFGPAPPHAATAQAPRPAPLVVTDLLAGVASDDVIADEHVYTVVDGRNLTLDLYRPAFAEGSLPVVIAVHGGGWVGGDKRDLPELYEYLASRGHVVAAVAYRLAPRWQFPAAQEDLAAAMRYVQGLAHSHGLDPDRIVLLGRSVGAQIALLAAYTAGDPAIRGAISFYGPFALRWGYDNPARPGVVDSSGLLETYLGGPPATHGERYLAAEPARFVSPASPPTLFIQGLRDEHVSPFHAEFVSARLIDAGVPHAVVRLPWATHGCDYIFSGPCGQVATYAVERFLGAVLAPRDEADEGDAADDDAPADAPARGAAPAAGQP